jgi:hypothetical protein
MHSSLLVGQSEGLPDDIPLVMTFLIVNLYIVFFLCCKSLQGEHSSGSFLPSVTIRLFRHSDVLAKNPSWNHLVTTGVTHTTNIFVFSMLLSICLYKLADFLSFLVLPYLILLGFPSCLDANSDSISLFTAQFIKYMRT